MIVWFVVILSTVIVLHESAHRSAFSRSGLLPHKRNRFALLNRFLDVVAIKKGKRPVWETVDYWRWPKSAGLTKKLSIGFSGVVRGFFISWFVFSVLAFFNLPNVFEGQYEFYEDQTTVQNDLRVIKTVPVGEGGVPGVAINSRIERLGTEAIRSPEHFNELEQHFDDNYVELEYADSEGDKALNIPVDENESGLVIRQIEVNKYGRSALWVGLVTTLQMAYFVVSALWGGATNLGEGFELLFNADRLGYAYLFFAFGFVNIAYTVINLLPVPPFDVGRLIRNLLKDEQAS